MRRAIRLSYCFWIATLGMFLASSPAEATEFNLTHYPPGTNTVLPALMPPVGATVLFNYTTYYSADRLNNSEGESAVPSYKVTAVANASRLLHTWTKANGVSWTSGVVVVVIDADQRVPNRRETGGGFADLVIQPVLLSAAFGDLNVLAGFDVSLPTGRFSQEKLVNPGLNYFTVAPQFAVTWLPSKKAELSLYSNIGFNFENPATNYKSGHYVNVDYSVGYRPIPSLPALQTSVVGYVFEQFTDDKVNGGRFRQGNRGRVFAVGPQIRYQFDRGGIILKWQHEVAAKNRPLGDRIQLQFAFRF